MLETNPVRIASVILTQYPIMISLVEEIVLD